MNSNDIFKQLAINAVLNASDLQLKVKEFVFYDRVEAYARQKKRGLINMLKLGLSYYLDNFNEGHWGLSYRYERQLQAVNCPCCGNFHLANNQDASTLNPALTCQCDDDYVEEIINYTTTNHNPEPNWLLYNFTENYDDQDEDEREEQRFQGITIDYGIDYLLRHF
jgi:hypothetical protein